MESLFLEPEGEDFPIPFHDGLPNLFHSAPRAKKEQASAPSGSEGFSTQCSPFQRDLEETVDFRVGDSGMEHLLALPVLQKELPDPIHISGCKGAFHFKGNFPKAMKALHGVPFF